MPSRLMPGSSARICEAPDDDRPLVPHGRQPPVRGHRLIGLDAAVRALPAGRPAGRVPAVPGRVRVPPGRPPLVARRPRILRVVPAPGSAAGCHPGPGCPPCGFRPYCACRCLLPYCGCCPYCGAAVLRLRRRRTGLRPYCGSARTGGSPVLRLAALGAARTEVAAPAGAAASRFPGTARPRPARTEGQAPATAAAAAAASTLGPRPAASGRPPCQPPAGLGCARDTRPAGHPRPDRARQPSPAHQAALPARPPRRAPPPARHCQLQCRGSAASAR